MYQYLYDWIIFHCMGIPQFVYSYVSDRNLCQKKKKKFMSFYLLAAMNHVAINICVQISVWACVLIFLGFEPRSGIAVSDGTSVFNRLRN